MGSPSTDEADLTNDYAPDMIQALTDAFCSSIPFHLGSKMEPVPPDRLYGVEFPHLPSGDEKRAGNISAECDWVFNSDVQGGALQRGCCVGRLVRPSSSQAHPQGDCPDTEGCRMGVSTAAARRTDGVDGGATGKAEEDLPVGGSISYVQLASIAHVHCQSLWKPLDRSQFLCQCRVELPKETFRRAALSDAAERG
jgi:hypothetical protein